MALTNTLGLKLTALHFKVSLIVLFVCSGLVIVVAGCLLQVQKKNYREEKKRATKELLSTITDPSVIVMADWLKVKLGKVAKKNMHNNNACSIVLN